MRDWNHYINDLWKFLTCYFEKGIIERFEKKSKEGERKHYILHNTVFKWAKDTTKVRIVYDASAKTEKTNLSLNECLYRGPVILKDLCGLLLRFQMKWIGIIADIEKTFYKQPFNQKKETLPDFYG